MRIASIYFSLLLSTCTTPAVSPEAGLQTVSTETQEKLPQSGNGTIERPFYWTLHHEKGEAYFLGTIHLGVDATELPQQIWKDLKRSQHVFVEINMSEGASPSTLAKMILPQEKSIEDYLKPEAIQKLKAHYPPETYDKLRRFKPWVLFTGLLAESLPTQYPIDKEIDARSQQQGKHMHYLESSDFQVGMLDKWFTPSDVEQSLLSFDQEKIKLEEAIAAYRSGNDKGIEAFTFDAPSTLATEKDKKMFYNDFLWQRNKKWVEKIVACLDKKGNICFIAVGVGHFLGDEGLVGELKKKGFSLERWNKPTTK